MNKYKRVLISLIFSMLLICGLSGCIRFGVVSVDDETTDNEEISVNVRNIKGLDYDQSYHGQLIYPVVGMKDYTIEYYNLETETREILMSVPEEDKKDIEDYVILGENIFYLIEPEMNSSIYELVKYDIKEDKHENLGELPEEGPISLGQYGDLLFCGYLGNCAYESGAYFWDTGESDTPIWQNLNQMLPDGDTSGEEYHCEMDGMIIGRYYKADCGKYVISSLREAATDRMILYDKDFKYKIGEDYIYLKKKDGRYYYREQRYEEEMVEIEAISNAVNKKNVLMHSHVMVEDDILYGVIAQTSLTPWFDEEIRGRVEKEILFMCNPRTGESKVLYDTKDEYTVIAGYRKGKVYLFDTKELLLIAQDVNTGESEVIRKMPEVECKWYNISRIGNTLHIRSSETEPALAQGYVGCVELE